MCSVALVVSLCDPEECSRPGSSVCGIFPARLLEWVAMPSFKWSSQPRDRTHISWTGRQILYHWATREAPHTLNRSLVIAKPPSLLPLHHFSAAVFFLKHDQVILYVNYTSIKETLERVNGSTLGSLGFYTWLFKIWPSPSGRIPSTSWAIRRSTAQTSRT